MFMRSLRSRRTECVLEAAHNAQGALVRPRSVPRVRVVKPYSRRLLDRFRRSFGNAADRYKRAELPPPPLP